ncbi:16S rRNA (guanine(966)-N(2))-methyltransferase RsmD [Eudoraea chungangensis]|uniref:16S rRNA (guanine(966)-N(2))-methyltransferase RsmD n=1 Tax=Eudoraea chungangensis TaxID=1481905 RepID=UPI0023EBBC4C|nr:16S rRNA (guanine(966)-N(2))-methyltransferase RsmD [Eudoraea chungangensis]
MRIISGTHKGRKIAPPKGLPVRPTTDMAKEAIFNVLNNRYHLDEISVLDLFAGTGNISLEFASRGVDEVLAIDKDYKCCAFIAKISKELELPIKVIKTDVLPFLEKTNNRFDLIFADPPYSFEDKDCESIRSLIFKKNLLKPDGLLIIEHSKYTDLTKLPSYTEGKKYGSSAFSFFQSSVV